jgi:hypothetical protein
VDAPLAIYEDDTGPARAERCRHWMLEALEGLDFVLQMLRWSELKVERKPLFLDSTARLILRAARSVRVAVPLAAYAPEDLCRELGERARHLTYGLEHLPDDLAPHEGVWRAHRRLLETLQQVGVEVW